MTGDVFNGKVFNGRGIRYTIGFIWPIDLTEMGVTVFC